MESFKGKDTVGEDLALITFLQLGWLNILYITLDRSLHVCVCVGGSKIEFHIGMIYFYLTILLSAAIK